MTTTYPPWAKWIAQDRNGEIWVFEAQPDIGISCWYPKIGKMLGFITKGKPNPHWRESLDCLGDDDETI